MDNSKLAMNWWVHPHSDSVRADHNLPTRLAVWLKYHYNWYVPDSLWGWADRHVDNWNETQWHRLFGA